MCDLNSLVYNLVLGSNALLALRCVHVLDVEHVLLFYLLRFGCSFWWYVVIHP